jgi:hypothetical protein
MAARGEEGQRRRLPVSACAQLLLLLLVGLLPFRPPAVGAMVLLPLHGARPADTLAWALSHDARLLGPGPYRGSLVVFGSRAALVGPAFRHFTLILASAGNACSPSTKVA